MTRYAVNEVVNDATLGSVTILEPHEPTLNSPEQYTVQVNGGANAGAIIRAVLTQSGESAQAAEVQAAADAAEVAQTPVGT
jgi:hypothetical protein